MKKWLKLAEIIMITLFLVSTACVSTPIVPSSKPLTFNRNSSNIIIENTSYLPSNYVFVKEDILPRVLEFQPPPKADKNFSGTSDYTEKWNLGVDAINDSMFDKAIEYFSELAGLYDDQGRSYYNLAVCYFNIRDFESALEKAVYAKYKDYEADQLIDSSLSNIGYSLLQNREYIEAIGYLKSVKSIDARQNILYAYLELAKSAAWPENIIYYLYGGDYARRYQSVDENVNAIGNNLGMLIAANPEQEYIYPAIDVLNYCNTVHDNPFNRKSLGLLYSYLDQRDNAISEYQLALAKSKDNPELQKFLTERLMEFRSLSYYYYKKIPFKVSGNVEKAEFKISIPQNTTDQEVSDLQLTLNNRKVKFSYATDSQKGQFIFLEADQYLKTGENVIKISADIKRSAKRFNVEDFKGLSLNDYNKSDRDYHFYTKATEINILDNKVVSQIYNKIAPELKKATLLEIVHRVYMEVIDAMEYEMYAMETRPKSQILLRMEKLGYTGICEDYSVLTVSLLRRFGIPSLNITGPMFNSEIGHCWPAFFPPNTDTPIIIDTTWGDTSEMPPYYFLFNTNLTVIESFGLDSDYIPSGNSISYYYLGTGKITLESFDVMIDLK